MGHTLMDARHRPGFKQFPERGLRYVAEWNGEWLALLGRQTGVFQCRPRDRWLGWHKTAQFRRLHLIGNSTRFLVLPQGERIPNLASRVLAMNLRRLKCLPFRGLPPEGETGFQPSEPVEGAKGGCGWSVRACRRPFVIGVTRAGRAQRGVAGLAAAVQRMHRRQGPEPAQEQASDGG